MVSLKSMMKSMSELMRSFFIFCTLRTRENFPSNCNSIFTLILSYENLLFLMTGKLILLIFVLLLGLAHMNDSMFFHEQIRLLFVFTVRIRSCMFAESFFCRLLSYQLHMMVQAKAATWVMDTKEYASFEPQNTNNYKVNSSKELNVNKRLSGCPLKLNWFFNKFAKFESQKIR